MSEPATKEDLDILRHRLTEHMDRLRDELIEKMRDLQTEMLRARGKVAYNLPAPSFQQVQHSVFDWSSWYGSPPQYPYHYPLEWKRSQSEQRQVMVYPPADPAWNVADVVWRKLRE